MKTRIALFFFLISFTVFSQDNALETNPFLNGWKNQYELKSLPPKSTIPRQKSILFSPPPIESHEGLLDHPSIKQMKKERSRPARNRQAIPKTDPQWVEWLEDIVDAINN